MALSVSPKPAKNRTIAQRTENIVNFHKRVAAANRSFSTILVPWVSLLVTGCSSGPIPDSLPIPGPTFTMVMASDTQYPWAPSCDGSGDATCLEREATAANRNQVLAIGALKTLTWPNNGTPLAPVRGIVVNGDITNLWHGGEAGTLAAIVKKAQEDIKANDPDNPALSAVPFLGLGNHDVFNNVCDCSQFGPFDANSCARNAVSTIRGLYSNKAWINFDPCSLAYSFDFNKYRFIQLHLWPGYRGSLGYWMTGGNLDERRKCESDPRRFDPSEEKRQKNQCDNDEIYDAWAWLQTTLDQADALGFKSVLMFHMHVSELWGDGDSRKGQKKYWPDEDVKKFVNIVKGHDVFAVFTGHIHNLWGKHTSPTWGELRNKRDKTVPVFLSGSSDNHTFLVAEFAETSLRVTVIDSTDGNVRFKPPKDPNPETETILTW